MDEQSRRKELREQYRQARPEAGVYRIVNTRDDRCLLSSSPNLASVRNRFEFARSTRSPGALDLRLHADAERLGLEAFVLEVLDVLETAPEATEEDILRDLATLEALWREKLDPGRLY
jgi:hypothetical protein